MESEQGSRLRGLFTDTGHSIRSRLLAGVVVIVPLLVTIWVIRLIFNFLDGWLRPIVERIFGQHIPGVGLLATLLLVYFAGALVTSIAGKQIVRWTERLLLRLPLIGDVYGSSKQIMETVSNPGGMGFKRVVSFEFPRPGCRAIGFVTKELSSPEGVRQFAIFMPTAPNPTSGFLFVIPVTEVEETGLAVDEAVKMLVSGGMVIPQRFRPRFGPPAGIAPTAPVSGPVTLEEAMRADGPVAPAVTHSAPDDTPSTPAAAPAAPAGAQASPERG